VPLYRYACPECKDEKVVMLKASETDWKHPECYCRFAAGLPPLQTEMVRMMGTPNLRAVETGDEYHGLKAVQGIKDMTTERARDHWRRHELPRIVEKDGKEKAVEQGLIDQEGNPKV
jgi:hypothetical protein